MVSKYVGKQLPAEVVERRRAESGRIAGEVESALAAAAVPSAAPAAPAAAGDAAAVEDRIRRAYRALAQRGSRRSFRGCCGGA